MLSDPHLVHSLRRLPLHHSRPRCEPFLGELKKKTTTTRKKQGNLGMACHHSVIIAIPPLLSQSENINYLRSQGWNQDEEKLCCLKFYRTSKKTRKFWVCMKHCMKRKRRKWFLEGTAQKPPSPATPQPACLRGRPSRPGTAAPPRHHSSASAGQVLTNQPQSTAKRALLYSATGH